MKIDYGRMVNLNKMRKPHRPNNVKGSVEANSPHNTGKKKSKGKFERCVMPLKHPQDASHKSGIS